MKFLAKRGFYGFWNYSKQMEPLNEQENLDALLLCPIIEDSLFLLQSLWHFLNYFWFFTHSEQDIFQKEDKKLFSFKKIHLSPIV